MSSLSTVNVDLGDRSYDIHIGAGLISGNAIPAGTNGLSGPHAVIITDETVAGHYLATVQSWLSLRFEKTDVIQVPQGEQSKSISVCETLWNRMIEIGTDRKSIVIALGGGVPGDLAGFVAATFARGIRFVQIPTTLLAQVDSSVGGKTGINLPGAKNIVGAFWQPLSVLIDPDVLNTLSDDQYRSGLAEVIKYGVIADDYLFQHLEQKVAAINDRDSKELEKIIAWCCRIKAGVVAEDEKETSGRRMILNYGHTYGHAIEAVYGYGKFTHGAAIAIGMNCAARLANALKMSDTDIPARQSNLMQQLGISTDCPDDRHEDLLTAMKSDKKVLAGKLKLILPTRIGHVEIVDAPDDEMILNSMS